MTTPAAMIMPQSTIVALKRSLTPTGSVFSSSDVMRTSAKRKSFQARMNVKMPAAMSPGNASGNVTYQAARAPLPRPPTSSEADPCDIQEPYELGSHLLLGKQKHINCNTD